LSRLWPSVFKPHLLSGSACLETRDVDQIIGAFFLVRRSLFERLGGFDERFFVYFEEVDFSMRARELGFRSRLLAEATACHHGGLSSEQVRAERLFYSLRSRLLYAAKHFSAPERGSVAAVTLFIEPLVRAAAAAGRLSGREIVETMRAYGMLARDWTAKITGAARQV
jgi:GT2 family glycosyltransferase